jgi:hypothetical protein
VVWNGLRWFGTSSSSSLNLKVLTGGFSHHRECLASILGQSRGVYSMTSKSHIISVLLPYSPNSIFVFKISNPSLTKKTTALEIKIHIDMIPFPHLKQTL